MPSSAKATWTVKEEKQPRTFFLKVERQPKTKEENRINRFNYANHVLKLRIKGVWVLMKNWSGAVNFKNLKTDCTHRHKHDGIICLD